MGADQGAGLGANNCQWREVVQLVVTARRWTKELTSTSCWHITGRSSRSFGWWATPSFPFWELPFHSGTFFFSLPLRGANAFQLRIQPSLTSWSFHLSFGSWSRTSPKTNQSLSWNVCALPLPHAPVIPLSTFLIIPLARVPSLSLSRCWEESTLMLRWISSGAWAELELREGWVKPD